MLEWALRYLALGWPVIPLRGKLPLTENGSKDASLSEVQVRAWWKKWPTANVGLATGHGWFAVDVDVKSGGEETWDMLRTQHGVPETIQQITGSGGFHILYLEPPDFKVKNSQGKLGPGLDVRGEGGYIVAAPSIHPETRKNYVWDGMQEIEQQKLAPAPVWLLRSLRELEATPKKVAAAAIPTQIREGGRNDTLFRTGCRLRRMGWTGEEIFASLEVINRMRCSPPLKDDELRTIAGSAARYAPDRNANVFRHTTGSAIPIEQEEIAITGADVQELVDQAIANKKPSEIAPLIPHIAKLRPDEQYHIEAKLREGFGREFPIASFKTALRAESKVVAMPRPQQDSEDEPASTGPDLLEFPLTDSGNGERIVRMFGHDLRYCAEMEKWLLWDGRRWAIDDLHAVTLRVKEMARLLYAQALRSPARAAVEKWARTSESAASIAQALRRASTEGAIPVRASQLDQNPYLLNCANGVIDLRNGTLLAHAREYLMTKLCHVTFKPEAQCPRFLEFLHWAMGQNPEAELTERTVHLVSFMQRALGYALTADVSEKAVFVFYGSQGNNGKTTLLETWRTLLGEYSAQISIDVLMTQRGSTDATMRADLADMRGARLVTTSEVEKEHKLSEGKLKYITAGMGRIKSCRKYENPIEFDATHKLFMDCNHRPRVTGTDLAIWSRLKSVPFEVRIEKTDPGFDPQLKDKLVAEGPGILAWAVRGAVKWSKEGLGEPPEIGQATAEWREHDDPLKEFLEDCCEMEGGRWVKSADLAAAYAWWCKENREKFPLGREGFGDRIRSLGLKQSRSRRDSQQRQLRTWEGIGMKDGIAERMRSVGWSARGEE